MKKIILIVLVIVVLIGGVYVINNYNNLLVEEPIIDENGIDQNDPETPATVSEDMSALLDNLYSKTGIEISMPISAVIEAERASEYIGLTAEEFTDNVVDSALSESMMSPSNYSLCIIKVKENSDKATLMNTILTKSNPGKWICMCAEYVLVANVGDYIMLAMSNKENCTNLKNALFEIYPDKKGNVVERVVGL